MSKIFKRLLCALLGMIIGMVSTLGAVAATVYYTYGNLTVGDVSGNKYKDALGDLNSFSVEDIIGLAIKGGKAPENYTFADLEKDYGFVYQPTRRRRGRGYFHGGIQPKIHRRSQKDFGFRAFQRRRIPEVYEQPFLRRGTQFYSRKPGVFRAGKT